MATLDPHGQDQIPSPVPLPGGVVTGIGSMPGTDMAWALRVVRDELTDLPHLPELPGRGPGADMLGRTAVRLIELPVDLQPFGWRLVGRPGRDMARAEAFWREDVDRLAAEFDGWTGPLKVQLCGPWTLAAQLWLPRGERVLSDPGARADLAASLIEAIPGVLAEVGRAVPGAQPVLQVDEPSLPSVLDGRVTSASGLNRLRAVPGPEVVHELSEVVAAARSVGASTVLHCCADDPPVAVLTRSGADALALDTSLLGPAGWESVAAAVEGGIRLWAGDGRDAPAEAVERSWRRVGLSLRSLGDVVLTPPCGLAGVDPAQVVPTLRSLVTSARELVERSQA